MQEATIEELVQACRGTLSPEECEEIAGMESFQEAVGFAFTALEVLDIVPETFLQEKGILG